jgi:hypothetical protein
MTLQCLPVFGHPDVFNVEDYGADPAAGTADNTAIHNALADALANGGTLYFPSGTWDLSTALVITSRIEIMGCSPKTAIVAYSGSGGAIQGAFTTQATAELTSIHDLRINGTQLEGQSAIVMGTNGTAIQNLTIKNIVTEYFNNGYGIYVQAASIGTRIIQNKIGCSREAITLRSACASVIENNYTAYWANTGIRIYGVSTDEMAIRNNVIRNNAIHGNGAVNQDILQDRAAIKLDSAASTLIENNYIECIQAPAGGGGKVGHGIWLIKTDTSLTQNNLIVGNYFGPGTTGKAIKLGSGVVSHTTIGGNSLGTYLIQDDGYYTVYQLQYLPDISQLTGTCNTRRGWIGLTNSVTQLHQ